MGGGRWEGGERRSETGEKGAFLRKKDGKNEREKGENGSEGERKREAEKDNGLGYKGHQYPPFHPLYHHTQWFCLIQHKYII